MKIKKGSSKVKKKKNVNKGAAPPPLPPLPDEDPKDKLPKAYMDFSGRLPICFIYLTSINLIIHVPCNLIHDK